MPADTGGRLAGSVAIVTGAGTHGEGVGAGKAISVRFAREGASLCLVDRAVERAEETRMQVEEEGGAAFAVEADVGRSDDCARAVAEAVERYGKLNVLVNNAAVPAGDDSEETWDRNMETNLKGPMLMSRFSAPHMAAAGGGSIVNISSI